jgi:3-oxoacyl-[acyl-carrier protein] reductase
MDHTQHSQIISISSLAATMTNEASAYAAAKAGVEALTKSIAKQSSMTSIRANCIAPGPIQTEFIKDMPEFIVKQGVDRQIINKYFTPEDIADVVELLLDPRSNSITGQVLNIGGV